MNSLKYTPLDEAAETIRERWQDETLQARLATFLGDEIPDGPFESSNSAIFAEYIARPTGKDLCFAYDAIAAGLVPWWLTYTQDRFVTTNPKKVGMLRPQLAMPKGQNTRSWVVPAGSRSGRIGLCPTIFEDMPTIVDFWDELRRFIMPRNGLGDRMGNVRDISHWYRNQAFRRGATNEQSLAGYYYPAIMGLYATRAVLFSDFDKYPDFKASIAMPAFTAAAEALGVEPVVVQWQSPGTVPALDGSREINSDQTDLTWLSDEQVKVFRETGSVILAGVDNE